MGEHDHLPSTDLAHRLWELSDGSREVGSVSYPGLIQTGLPLENNLVATAMIVTMASAITRG